MTEDQWRAVTEAIEHIKDIIVARVTQSGGSESYYRQLRAQLVADPNVKTRLPEVVKRCRTLDEVWSYTKARELPSYQQRRDFYRDEFDPILSYRESEASEPGHRPISESLAAVDAEAIRTIWAKALDRLDGDPEGAITAARTLVEAVCKHILTSDGIHYAEAADLPKLYRATADHLQLSPSQHTEDVVKRILGGAQSIVEGLATLRNRWSDSHGPAPKTVRPLPRHARLAVNMAGALSAFLFDTWRERTTRAPSPQDEINITLSVDLADTR